jgi:hypothetical protein
VNISDEAVEAAARALAVQAWGQWEYVPNELRRAFLRDAKITLEAAAPFIAAEAWDEGYQGCYDRYMYEPVPTNPYRSQA